MTHSKDRLDEENDCRAFILWQDAGMRLPLMFLPLAVLVLLSCSAPSQVGSTQIDFSKSTLAALREMPQGGGYSGSDATKNKLPLASSVSAEGLSFSTSVAQPSFCSGATYLVFLKTLQATQKLSPKTAQALVVKPNQTDGHGIFGRWNANGPGCAKLVTDLDCGINFTSWEKAQPGDFLKIWWTENIGGKERGHHVVYLGHDEQSLRFWSSNQPNGYGEKTIPRSDCKRILFTRITKPAAITKASQLPAKDPWLERMLKDDFTWNEVRQKCQIRD